MSNYFNPRGNECYITWYTASGYVLTVNAVNACGASSNCWYPLTVGSGNSLSVSPNPASDNVQVTITEASVASPASDTAPVTSQLMSTGTSSPGTTYTVRVYNAFGTLSYSAKKLGDTFTVPVNDLKDGIYIVEANDGKESYRQQFIVKH